VLSRQLVKPQAFFGFGSKPAASGDKAAAPQYYICTCSGLAVPVSSMELASGIVELTE
jgi:hypothetical protein